MHILAYFDKPATEWNPVVTMQPHKHLTRKQRIFGVVFKDVVEGFEDYLSDAISFEYVSSLERNDYLPNTTFAFGLPGKHSHECL